LSKLLPLDAATGEFPLERNRSAAMAPMPSSSLLLKIVWSAEHHIARNLESAAKLHSVPNVSTKPAMPILDVPHFSAEFQDACAVACLQMAYKYLRPSKLSRFKQKPRTLSKNLKADGQGPGRHVMTTDDLVKLARGRGLNADWGRVNIAGAEMVAQISRFVGELKIPLIACQRNHLNAGARGHFRVIIGLEDDEIIFHDPDPETGGASIRWPLPRFIDHWRTYVPNVTGGVAVWIATTSIDSRLSPDQPNLWAQVGPH
jgi:hypothetical protein